MFKLLLLAFLLSSAKAIPSLRRLVQENTDILAALDDIDVSCSLSMPDRESCSKAVDSAGGHCVWCALGSDIGGGCVGSTFSDLINSAEIPHLHCGDDLTDEDVEFYDDLEGCVVDGFTADACLDDSVGSSCTWCINVDGPAFGICFNPAFVDEARSLDDPEDPDSSFDSAFACTTSPDEDQVKIGALTDTSCITDGNPDEIDIDVAEQCSETQDAAGKDCVVANFFGMMEFCVTATQKDVVDFVMAQLSDMGIDDPMSILGSLAGAGPVLGDGSGFGDFGADEDATEIAAEEVNAEEEMEVEDEETGQ